MSDSWKEDNCQSMKAHYAVYSVPQAAALWCGVPENTLQQIVNEATQLSGVGFGRGVWMHSLVPCLEPRSRAIAEAIESGDLPHGREDAQTVENDHVAYERRHVFGRELKKWMEKAFPNEKPAFLFDDIEQNSHSSITAESYRALKAERDALKGRVENAVGEFKKLRDEKSLLASENESLKAIVKKLSPPRTTDKTLSDSEYWVELSQRASSAVKEYPAWSETQRTVQKSGNLQEWLTKNIGTNNREAEIVKKVLSDFYKELR